MFKFLRLSFLCDGQGADSRAILSGHRACLTSGLVHPYYLDELISCLGVCGGCFHFHIEIIEIA